MKTIIGILIGIILSASLLLNAGFLLMLRKHRLELWDTGTRQQRISYVEFWTLTEPVHMNKPDTTWLKLTDSREIIQYDSTYELKEAWTYYIKR